MLMRRLYNISITKSVDKVEIDTNTTLISVKVLDYNHAPVSTSISVECELGSFVDSNSMSDKTIINSKIKGFTAVTDSNGEYSFSYSADEFGFETITVYNKKLQFLINGWRVEYLDNYNNLRLYYNHELVTLLIANQSNSTLNLGGTSWTTIGGSGVIPSDYRPVYNVYAYVFNGDRMVRVTTSGTIQAVNRRGTTGTQSGYEWIIWGRK